MDVQTAGDGVLASVGGSSVRVSLHPLVVMNISDHYTRVRVQSGDIGARGALLLATHVLAVNKFCVCIQFTEPCWADRKGVVWRYVTRLS